MWASVLVGSLEEVTILVQQVANVLGTQLGEGGAVTALVVASVTVKQLITDAYPKIIGK